MRKKITLGKYTIILEDVNYDNHPVIKTMMINNFVLLNMFHPTFFSPNYHTEQKLDEVIKQITKGTIVIANQVLDELNK